ncbi:kinase-like protein, partial [Gonapodya prolifera JEL478]
MEIGREDLPGLWRFWEIQESEVTFTQEKLGKGGVGTVMRGLWQGQVDVAVKSVEFKDGSYSYKEFNQEARVWYNMTSRRLLPLYGIITTGTEWRFLSPFMENGDAMSHLAKFQDATERHKMTLSLLRDIAEGMEYLHSRNVVHADLKPEQILVDRNGRAVVTDFGFSKVGRSKQQEPVPSTIIPAASSTTTSARRPIITFPDTTGVTFTVTGGRWGTPKYMSPERLLGKGTTTNDDVYAFGITILALWTLAPVYPQFKASLTQEEQDALWENICNGELRPHPASAPDPAHM